MSKKHYNQVHFWFFFAEISDQNFVDEDQGEKSSCASMVKRLKTSAADASSSDQVITKRNFVTAAWLTYLP